MPGSDRIKPVTFFLNEHHELLPQEKPSGGRITQYLGIDWESKGQALSVSLRASRRILAKSQDPIRESRHYLIAKPSPRLQKRSTARNAKDNALPENVSFAKSDSQVFGRLGIDLINVTKTGDAIVHLLPERADQLEKTGARLASLSQREHARWAKLDSFDIVPAEERIDASWLSSVSGTDIVEAVIEFQPLLDRVEIERLMRSMSEFLRKDLRESFTRMGQDFSGRFWAAGRLTRRTLQQIAQRYFTVQALHPPLIAITAATKPTSSKPTAGGKRGRVDITLLPPVAVVDTGVPSDHAVLAPRPQVSDRCVDRRMPTSDEMKVWLRRRLQPISWNGKSDLHLFGSILDYALPNEHGRVCAWGEKSRTRRGSVSQ